jgi:O-antigen biosynthesis protein
VNSESKATQTPSVTVVVPAYNAEATIDDCVGSLLELKEPVGGMEIIVVDNNSSDATLRLLKQYEGQIRILREQKRGASAARNRAIVEARGKILAFTDSDCIAEREWVSNLIPPLTDRRVGASGGRILSLEPCNWIEKYGEVMHDHRRAIEIYRRPYIIGMNFAVRRSIFDEVGLFDIDLLRGQDTDMGWRIHAAGYQIRYCSGAEVHHLNESTLRGLFFDGVDHGHSQVLLAAKYPHQQASSSVQMRSAAKGIARRIMRGLMSKDRPTSVCELIYNSGKLYGQLKWSRSVNRIAKSRRNTVGTDGVRDHR